MPLFNKPFQPANTVSGVASTASMRAGNMIYTAIQNARTKREVKALFKIASEANFQNRAVAIMPGISKQQLLLITNEPDDNDVYDYKSNSTTAALDYVWGESDDPENVIISGGQNIYRVSALIPFVHKSQVKEIPVIVLHTGNAHLEAMLQNHCRDYEFISANSCYYDVFRGMPVEDIAYLLYETMPQGVATPAAESLIRSLLEVLLVVEGKITLHNLAAFPIISLKDRIEELHNDGTFSDDEYMDVNHYYMAGSSDSDAVRIFLNRLNRQAESIFGKNFKKPSNIKRMLNQKGIIAINVGGSGNDLVVTLVLNQLLLLQSQGRTFSIVIDSVPVALYPQLSDLLRGHYFAISNQDFISSLYGGKRKGEDIFSELSGEVSETVLLRHSSGTTCQKWSDHLGKYRKIKIRYNIAQNNAFMNTSNSRGLSVEETDEPRIRAETLGKLPDGLACIHNTNGILLAEIREA